MTGMRITGVALAALLAVSAQASPSPGAPGSGASCVPRVPVMPPHPDARHVVLLATATADTVQAGWGDVNLQPGERRPRRWRTLPVHGQTAQAARVAGPGSDGLSPGPVVLVPWYPGCVDTFLWYRSFAWLRPGEPAAIVGRLRRPEDWVGGVATIDVLRPDLVRESGELPGAARWTAGSDRLFSFYATLPTRQQIATDPWDAVEPMRAWLAAHPAEAPLEPLRYVSGGIYRTAAHAAVRADTSPLAGTYRIEVSRTGGPTHVVYARTELVAAGALFLADTVPAVFPSSAAGYSLKAWFSPSESRLPSPRPGAVTRFWRRIAGVPHGDQMELWLPGDPAPDGTRRLRGHLGLWNLTPMLFPDDPALGEWIGEWSHRETYDMRVRNPVGEIVLRPDGDVEWSEVLRLDAGRAVTIRGVRISSAALESATAPHR